MKRNLIVAVPGVSIGALIGAAVLGAGVAWASHTDNLVPFGPPGAIEPAAIRQTDNSAVYYYMDSVDEYKLEQVDRNVVNDMLDSEFRPTDLSFHYDSSPVFSGSGETDTIWQEGAVSGSDEGITWCNDPEPGYSCDQHYIRIEGAGTYSKGLSCHEMGHAVGLTHGADAYPSVSNTNYGLRCMRKPVPLNDILGAHNRGQINGVY